MKKERYELAPINQKSMVNANKQLTTKNNRWADKIDNYLVLCSYEQGVRDDIYPEEEGKLSTIPLHKQYKANSFVIFEKVYRESKSLFINLRVAARNQVITSIAEILFEILQKKYENNLPVQSNTIKQAQKKIIYDSSQSINKISNLIKNDTFLVEEKVWEDFCTWLRFNLTEWVLDEMVKTIGFERMDALSNKELNGLFHQYISDSLSDNPEFIAKFSDMVNQYILVWVEEIILSLNLRNYSKQQIEVLLAVQNGRVPFSKKSIHTNDRTDYIHVMNNAAYQYVREALYKKSFGSYKNLPWPTTPLYKGNMEGVVQLRPQFPSDQQNANFVDIAWSEVENITDLDVDVFDALCSIFLLKARHSHEVIEILFDDLLLMRGLKAKLGGEGRRGGYEHNQRQQVLKSLTRIQSLWIELEKAVIYVKGKPVQMKLEGRTFLFKDSQGNECNIMELADKKKFSFTVDKVFSRYLYGSGRQIAILPIKTLQYNPYRQTWEKRLARYVSWRWRTQARKGDYLQPNKISTLLNAIGEKMNQRTPSRTRDRLEKALDTLLDDGIIAAWYYDEKWDESIADFKGWSRLWLNSTIIIEPPAIIKEQYQSIERRKKSKFTQEKMLETKSMQLISEQLKLVRSNECLTLSQVAAELEVSPSYISHIESGTKIPSVKIQNKIINWLQRFH